MQNKTTTEPIDGIANIGQTIIERKWLTSLINTYKEMCKFVQERSWHQWVEECNFDISTTEL